ncbi:MAG: hypothetical protein M1587_02260 [Thaumarchaeota archaeon]|nr:hypothetical protein [Nitrososphaerota archaeon]MDG6906856.1 hypothetical protein [Nitrososphaerota archaeon]
MVDTDDARRHSLVGFSIAEEPLLKKVFFEDRKSVSKEFGSEIWMPDPALLLEMKINSMPDRPQDDKRMKDLSDICALLLYSGVKPSELSNGLETREKFRQAISGVSEHEWDRVAGILDEQKLDLKRIVREI